MSSFKYAHQVDPKDSRSQNFSFLAFEAETLGAIQILRKVAATARDRRNFFYRLNHVMYC
jgi:hypothetical protein